MFTKDQILLRGNLERAVAERHSVRRYTDQPIDPQKISDLRALVRQINALGEVGAELHVDSPDAFGRSLLARYGGFRGVTDYFLLTSKRGDPMADIKVGFYGEQLVLRAQQLGLNTCWVGLTFSKKHSGVKCGPGEKIRAAIAVGYGETPGVAHKSKDPEKIAPGYATAPPKFKRGIDWALLAPTAMNQQKFRISIDDKGQVSAKPGIGYFTRVDLGIAWLHFMLGSR